VFPRDRACAEAWAVGGKDAEKEERQRWDTAERKKMMDNVNALLDRRNLWQAEQEEAKRRAEAEEGEGEKDGTAEIDLELAVIEKEEANNEATGDIPDLEDNEEIIDVKINPNSSSIFSNTCDNIDTSRII